MGSSIQQKMEVQLATECHMSHLRYRMILYNIKKFLIHLDFTLEIVKLCVKKGSPKGLIIASLSLEDWNKRMLSDCLLFHSHMLKPFFCFSFWVLKSV